MILSFYLKEQGYDKALSLEQKLVKEALLCMKRLRKRQNKSRDSCFLFYFLILGSTALYRRE